jgi:small subunit ribosomal protein S21
MRNDEKFKGLTVIVTNDDVNRALKKLKNKMEDCGKLKDLQKKEFYEKPTTERKRKKAAAKVRYQKKLENEQLPKKMY